MNEQDTVRDLLGLAVDSVEPPAARSGESVFARAAALRRRRRVAVTGAVAVVVAAGVVLGSGVLPDGSGEQNVTASGNGSAGAGKGQMPLPAADFKKLLPAGVGEVGKAAWADVGLREAPPQAKWADGQYAAAYSVTRDGGVGYITVHALKSVELAQKDFCASDPKSRVDCISEKAPGGGRLSIARHPDKKTPKESSSMVAVLSLKDGTVLTVISHTGVKDGKPGRKMMTYPLTRAQLGELALNPALLP